MKRHEKPVRRGLHFGRKTAAVVMAFAVAGCGGNAQTPGQGNSVPGIQLEKIGEPPVPEKPPIVGGLKEEWVCKGFVSDGNRLVKNPLVDGPSVFNRHDYTPLHTKRTAFNLETVTSPMTGKLQFYTEDGEPLPKERNPECYWTKLGIVAVKTNLRNPSGDDPLKTAFYVRPKAMKSDGTLVDPDFV
ncbi:MAG TPA: hypothetical protein VF733_05880, partial [Candidatus Saccharimonadales bacterium]